MKHKFKIKAICKDDNIIVEVKGDNIDLLIGLRCIIKSIIENTRIPSGLIIATVSDALEEARK